MSEEIKINAILPKGFSVEVQETKQFRAKNILVLVNDKKERLYLKLCSMEDILKGFIWEIIRPSELKKYKVEESYNTEIWKERGLLVQESASEDEDYWKTEEGKKMAKEAEKKRLLGEKGVTINLISADAKKNNDGEAEAERLRAEIEKGGEVEKWARREQLKSDLLEIKEELEQERAESKGATGQIPLVHDPDTGKLVPFIENKGFDSVEAMIDNLTEMEHSQNPEEARYAKEVLNEMFRKWAMAVKKGELGRPIAYEPKEGKSIIRKMLDKQNERMRAKLLKIKREKKDET